MEIGLIFIAFIVVAIGTRLVVAELDEGRVRVYIEERGGKLLSAEWAPFGRGWVGERNNRIYEVRYLDSEGNEHEASCKTSLLSGVYFTEDRVVRPARRRAEERKDVSHFARIEIENRRLRAELERLKSRDA